MIHKKRTSKEIDGMVSLFYLMIHADGKISDKEVKMGELMCAHEMIDKGVFETHLDQVNKESKEDIYQKCLSILRNCDHDFNLRCIAWMSLIANSDGFMSKEEWSLLYKIYAKELHLDLSDIIDYQKQLPKS